MAHLIERPTLQDLQQYVDAICQERGWTIDTSSEKFMLFTEEVGELAKAIRNVQGLYQERTASQAPQRQRELEEEFADVLSYLLDLANYFHVDLEKAFRAKEQINQARTWE